MIKNVVFDYGNVMIHFDPRYMVSRYVSDANDVEMLTPIIFDRLYWDALDEGSISDGEVVEAVKKRILALCPHASLLDAQNAQKETTEADEEEQSVEKIEGAKAENKKAKKTRTETKQKR